MFWTMFGYWQWMWMLRFKVSKIGAVVQRNMEGNSDGWQQRGANFLLRWLNVIANEEKESAFLSDRLADRPLFPRSTSYHTCS